MYLYVYEGFEGGSDRQKKTDRLIKKAAQLYVDEKSLYTDGMSWEIVRSEKGKPSFKELPLQFSVSHSGHFWVCLISEKNLPVGVDIQVIKNAKTARVAEKYFTSEEQVYIKEGIENFFQIWCRKEAYGKYTGNGITKDLAAVSTLENEAVAFVDFQIEAGIKGACCVREQGDLCLRTI